MAYVFHKLKYVKGVRRLSLYTYYTYFTIVFQEFYENPNSSGEVNNERERQLWQENLTTKWKFIFSECTCYLNKQSRCYPHTESTSIISSV